jgi:uncharacterized protein YmfQ (DUF2313 family)
MARSSEAYQAALLQLLPPGAALPRDLDTVLSQVMLAIGDSLARFDARVDDLLREADPRYAVELLPEWEADFGLPDPCAGEQPTIALRQAQVVAQMTSPPLQWSQSIAAFQAMAAAIGVAITITEPQLWTCMSRCTDPMYTHAAGWDFAWYVNAPLIGGIEVFTCMDTCITPLRSWGNALLQCVIQRDAPPDTTVIFAFS